jgi:hypothetical protein
MCVRQREREKASVCVCVCELEGRGNVEFCWGRCGLNLNYCLLCVSLGTCCVAGSCLWRPRSSCWLCPCLPRAKHPRLHAPHPRHLPLRSDLIRRGGSAHGPAARRHGGLHLHANSRHADFVLDARDCPSLEQRAIE